ncbi:MAG: hypothetical protein NWE98_12390 [Candidatus Bathyarchaeota archaeon]|nr:hypothetical protein [Candidatus Bathyarchaeota archaeon]
MFLSKESTGRFVIVWYPCQAIFDGSPINLTMTSALGTSYTITVMCSGVEPYPPTTFIPYFWQRFKFAEKFKNVFFAASLCIGQLSGLCLTIHRKNIKLLLQLNFPVIK